MKGWSFPFRRPPSLCNSAEDGKNSTVSESLRACMIDKGHRAYVLFDIDDMKFSRKADWLRETRAAPVQMNATLASVELKRDFSFARIESCVAAGYYAVREASAKHRGYSVLKGFADTCNFPACPSKSLGRSLCSLDKRQQSCIPSCKNDFQGNEQCIMTMVEVSGAQF